MLEPTLFTKPPKGEVVGKVRHASVADIAPKAQVVAAYWGSTMGTPLPPRLKGALDNLRHSTLHFSPQLQPDVPLGNAFHAEAVREGTGKYRTLWFSQKLSYEEKQIVARAYELVKSKLDPS